MSRRESSESLSREIGTTLLAVYGAGTILGAGIYVLIGKIAGEAGYWVPFAFLVSALVAGVNGMVYAELATRSSHAGGPSDYVDKAFGRQWFSVLIGWMIVATGIVSAATITNGFAGYIQHFVTLPDWLPRVGLLVVLGAVAAVGAKESAWFMAITTTLGAIGLLFVIYVGFSEPGAAAGELGSSAAEDLPALSNVATISSILTASFLAIYAYIGFEDIVHLAEEVKEPARSMPLGIATAIGVAAVFYFFVSMAATRVLRPDQMATSDAPLIDVVRAAGYSGWALAALSVPMILNGALAQIIMASRVIYSLGKRNGAPAVIARVNEQTRTPLNATALSVLVALGLALLFALAALAEATSFIMLLIFAASNAALIVLDRREPEAPFDIPVFVPWVGLALSLALIVGRFLVTGGGH